MGKDLDQRDIELFRKATAQVEPISHSQVELNKPKPAPEPKQTRLDEAEVLHDALTGNTSIDIETGEEINYLKSGVRPTILRKLRRGYYVRKAELDLHGLVVLEAFTKLSEFIGQSQACGYSCVSIIHGKGNRSPQGRPILKSKVAHWLRQRQDILAFCSARAVDGGSGAIYVLLKH